MKISHLNRPHSKFQSGLQNKPSRNPSGFALIATISVMVLLVMIALAMLSLSTLELRSSGHADAREEAKANARMALMMALGELQKHMGPDQRVSAEADIFSSDGFTKWDADSGAKHYVGVYSTENWNERDDDDIRRSMKMYDPERNEDAFVRWLTSGELDQVKELEFVQSAISSADLIQVVGEGSVGSTNSDDLVRVPKEKIMDSQGRVAGHLAWWVGDQGVKGKVNLANSRNNTASDWDGRFNRANPENIGVGNVAGFEAIDIASTPSEEVDKVVTQPQIKLLNGGDAITSDNVKARYHDVTTHSVGVLADVAHGGLKRDLSLPFELPSLSPDQGSSDWSYELNRSDDIADQDADFTSMWEFSNSGDQSSNWPSIYWNPGYRPAWWAGKLGYVFMYPDPSGGSDYTGMSRYLRGPTWHMLRNHYRLYKREYEKLPSADVSRRGWAAPSGDHADRTWLVRPYEPYSHWHNAVGEHLLSTTYVGAYGNLDNKAADTRRSPDVFDPFFSFGSNRGRPWNTLGHNSLGLAPVFTKVAVVLSQRANAKGGGVKYIDLIMNGIGTLWNPYNVPIEFEAAFTSIDMQGFKWNFTRERSDGSKIELAVDRNSWEKTDAAGKRGFGRDKDFPFQYFRLGVTAETNPNYPFEAQRPSKLIRLNPGETRTYALTFPEPKAYSWGSMINYPASFANNWEGGMFLRFSQNNPTENWLVEAGDKYRFELLPKLDASNNPLPVKIENYIGYFENSKGVAVNPFKTEKTGRGFEGIPELSSVTVVNSSDLFTQSEKRIEKLLTNFTETQEAICSLEFTRRASDDSAHGILAEYEPRAIVNHTYSMGQGSVGSVPNGWEAKVNLTSDFDLLQVGIGDRSNGYWGDSNEGDGQTHVVAFEVPDAPITNIASLQHCQLGSNGWDVSYAIGNSFPHPLVTSQSDLMEQESTATSYKTTYYDMSYLANLELWDRYYFSGLQIEDPDSSDPLADARAVMKDFLDPDEDNPLANKRLFYTAGNNDLSEADLLKELTHYRWIARHLMQDGTFNINSTRVEAWKALLSSLKNAELDKVVRSGDRAGDLTDATGDGTPFSRASVTGGDSEELWSGYVRLTDTEISTLAENIVVEVKKRGPFLSVADFVNRRLSNDATGKMGALQAALVSSSLETGSGSEKGVPGNIRQSDIMASIGGVISARSDTFVIRAYGESVSKADPNVVLARAWCEAVVQRMPTLVGDNGELLKKPNPDYPDTNPSKTDPYIDNDLASEAARTFGREFRIMSLRWLGRNEV